MPLAPVGLESLRERLRLRPLPPGLLEQALTHASYLNESDARAVSNERLEFLGDALLGLVIASELFRRYPDAPEGTLTRMRAELVRGSTLARVAGRFDLGEHVVLGRGEEAAGGRKRDRNLAGTLEAVIGAVYVAHGYRTTRGFILRLLRSELQQLQREGARMDAKSSLQHLVQARWHEPPEYVTVDEATGGPARRFVVDVRVGGVTLGRGEGASKREAQQRAAREAVARLAAEEEG
ncbi:MAG: ribonuclease III [Dehalococcoidia bacterium]|nr:ribonuclease III [Dehalococcoidia bacterium]